MKVNLKGQGGVKGVLLLHGEKLGMAVVGICALLFVYSSLGRERLRDNYRPENLRNEIRQAKQEVESFPWDQAPEKGVAHPLPDIADIAVQADAYVTGPNGWNPPVVPPTVLRTDPELLTAVDVEAHGGSGPLAFIDEELRKKIQLEREAERLREAQARQKEQEKLRQPDSRDTRRDRGEDVSTSPAGEKRRPAGSGYRLGVPLQGDERVEVAYWACVVAKVPVKDQLRLYRDAFENARGPGDDFPTYAGCFVERAEVRPGQQLQWGPVPVFDGPVYNGEHRQVAKGMAAEFRDQIRKDWAAPPGEVVDLRYLDDLRALVFPLPPLVGREWGKEATHPDIPLASEAVEFAAEESDVAAPDDVPAAGGSSLFGGHAAPLSGTNLTNRRSPRSVPFGMTGGGRPLAGFEGGFDSFTAEAAPYSTGRAGRGFHSGRAALPPGVTHWLVRFFDFDVQPGKKYKYRVRLVLADPNQDVRLQRTSLDPAVLDRITKEAKEHGGSFLYRLTDWSGPSATVGIPQAGGVRVAEAKTASEKLYNDEPRVRLLVESFDVKEKNQAIQAWNEKEFRRGNVANMTEDTEILVSQGREIEEVDSFKFHTGITVLDIRGGERLSKDIQQPARALLMDPAGQLSIRNELDDAGDVERYRTIFAKDDKRRGRGGPTNEFYPAGPDPYTERMMRGGGFEENFGR